MQPHIWIWVWVILAAILAIAEAFAGGFFYLPFAVGAGVAALLEFAKPGSVNWQWAAFVVLSGTILVIARRRIMARESRGSEDT